MLDFFKGFKSKAKAELVAEDKASGLSAMWPINGRYDVTAQAEAEASHRLSMAETAEQYKAIVRKYRDQIIDREISKGGSK